MSSTADLGGILIVLNVTAFTQIINMHERDRTWGDGLNSDQFRGGNGPSQFV